MRKQVLSLRINAELRATLVELAKKQNRPLSNLVETLLLEAVKREFMAKRKAT
ncbi:CopG family transcriptional regulator [Nitrosococcus oceani C-27]|uniref:CopG family transcriptional regulator n=2 Tax=Nitrosococcus oceani TaxID=1229 RepID=A0A0E2Z1H8_9GAMM|nr:CopG family transcriptional regulator [Nitrosococcus oceani]KFI19493.1 CopG family transcriptional regulator [Nitrosococcus oceani C-27]KFI22873.1 CopG family transcriptional regulator [Nitrosococcus oceani]